MTRDPRLYLNDILQACGQYMESLKLHAERGFPFGTGA